MQPNTGLFLTFASDHMDIVAHFNECPRQFPDGSLDAPLGGIEDFDHQGDAKRFLSFHWGLKPRTRRMGGTKTQSSGPCSSRRRVLNHSDLKDARFLSRAFRLRGRFEFCLRCGLSTKGFDSIARVGRNDLFSAQGLEKLRNLLRRSMVLVVVGCAVVGVE